MVTKEKVTGFIRRAYDVACCHGFHDVEHSDAHLLMLVLSEIGELVDADREGRHADLCMFDADGQDTESFVRHVKDTVEDEMADVLIRLFDYCGCHGYVPHMVSSGVLDMEDDFERIFGSMNVCEKCFALSNLVIDMSCQREGVDKERYLGMILSFCFEFARFYGFDLCRHVDEKMRYNEVRPVKHGKKY